MNIVVSNLSVHVFAHDLRKLFTAYGEVLMAFVFRSEANSRSLGTAIIEMPNNFQAVQAILCLNNTLLDGRRIMLRESRQEGCSN